uniref:Uncharacterized protein n=1 Tax=Glossina palpalis gambiensis TaxID=67801 RepID=A0A1B0AT48_9MUSC
MKTEATATTPNPKTNTSIANKMAFDMYPTISGKQQDPVREVVMKYIDYFLPEISEIPYSSELSTSLMRTERSSIVAILSDKLAFQCNHNSP